LEELQPQLIVAVGKTAAEVLLRRTVEMKSEHMHRFACNDRQVLVLLHPSRINMFMRQGEYVEQIATLMKHLT